MPYLDDALLVIFTTHREKDCLNDLFRDNYCINLYNPCLQSSIDYLKPFAVLYAWHVQVIYKILTGEPSVVRGDYMAAMLGPGDHLWQPHSVWGDHQWHDRSHILLRKMLTNKIARTKIILG